MVITLMFLILSWHSVKCGMQEFVELVTAVQQHFTSGCVFLLHDQGEHLGTTLMTVKVGKLMFKKYIQTTLSSRSNDSKSCQNYRPLYVLADKDNSFQENNLSRAIWLKFLETESLDDYFAVRDIPFDCEFLVAQPRDDHQFELTEVYRVSSTLPLTKHNFGNWTSRHGLNSTELGFYERRNSLHGAVLKTAIHEDSPFNSKSHNLTDDADGANFFAEVWRTLKLLMKFTPEYRFSSSRTHGVKLENGSWNGLLGVMERKEADVTSVDLSMSPSRAEVVDFMFPLLKDRQYVMMRKSDSFELYWGSFLKPFSTEIWVAVILTILLLAFVLWLIYCAGRRYWRDQQDGFILSLHIQDSFFYIFGSFCQQGLDVMPRSPSGRVVCLVSYLTAVVLVSGYSASLVSYLTLRTPVIPFSTFGGLMRDGTYKLGVLASSSVFSFFKESEDPLMHKLYMTFIHSYQEALPTTTPDGLRRVCEDRKYTFMTSLENLEQYFSNLTCRISPVSQAFLPGSRAMAVSRGSPYLGLFTHYLLKLNSGGILRRLSLMTNKKTSVEESPFVTMDIISVTPMFAILLVGVVTAIFILLVEMAINVLQKYNAQHDKYETWRNQSNTSLRSVTVVYNNRSYDRSLRIDFKM